jgi:hypothetical protein
VGVEKLRFPQNSENFTTVYSGSGILPTRLILVPILACHVKQLKLRDRLAKSLVEDIAPAGSSAFRSTTLEKSMPRR